MVRKIFYGTLILNGTNQQVSAADLPRALGILHVVKEDAALKSPLSTPKASPNESEMESRSEKSGDFFGEWEEDEDRGVGEDEDEGSQYEGSGPGIGGGSLKYESEDGEESGNEGSENEGTEELRQAFEGRGPAIDTSGAMELG